MEIPKRDIIVFLADSNYVEQAKQLFSSIYWKAGWKGDYMLLSHQISDNELKWFRDKGVLIRECIPLFDKTIGKNYSPIVLDKLYLFKTEFKKWNNVVFLDSDIIVRGSLERLTKINGFASVKSFLKLRGEFFVDSDLISDLSISFNLNKRAFCTGIMAFSTNIINDNTFDEIINLFKKYERAFLFGEEGVLNLYFYKKWKEIPNVFGLDFTPIAHLKIKPDDIHAVVLHFIRFEDKKWCKPWNPENPFFTEWTDNLQKFDLVNLGIVQRVKSWDVLKVYYYSLLYDFYIHYNYRSRTDFNVFSVLLSFTDRLIGRIGMIVNKISPNLYNKLKGRGRMKKVANKNE